MARWQDEQGMWWDDEGGQQGQPGPLDLGDGRTTANDGWGTSPVTMGGAGFDSTRVPGGVPSAWAEDFIRRNPGDYHRLSSAYASEGGPRSEQGGGTAAAYSSGTAGSGDAALSSFQSYLQQRDQASQQQRAALQQILMQQLGQASSPVSADSPGIREVLGGQRLALQRGADRQRANAAETRAYDGSGGVGGKAFDTDVSGILQNQAETDATMTGDVLNRELNAQRQKLTQLLTLATQLEDAESARLIRAQLDSIQTQLGQSNFYDQSAYQYAALNSNNNLQALMAILGAAA